MSHQDRDERDATALRRTLTTAADLPAPDDLATRVLERPEFKPATTRTSRWFTGSGPTRRTWAVAGAAASVAAVMLGVAVFGGSARPDSPQAGPAAGASSATTSSPAKAASSVPPTSASPSTTTTLGAALLPKGNYQAWSSQTVPCGGVPAVPDAEQQLLSPDVVVAGAAVCTTTEKQIPGDGVWLLAGERELTAVQTAALVDALTADNVPVDPAGVCDAMAILVPDFAVVLADGRTVRPGVPGDGCHPSRQVAAVLASAAESAGEPTTKVRQLRTQAMVDAGCDPAASPYWDPFSSGGTGAQGGDRPQAPKTASVCRYDATGDSPETRAATLTALGTPSAAKLKTALNQVLTAQVKPAGACTSAEHSFDPAADGWLTVVTTPAEKEAADKGSMELVLSVELGGCHRVLAPNGTGWFAPGPAVDALAALADERVELANG
jgi:hypothetical protein